MMKSDRVIESDGVMELYQSDGGGRGCLGDNFNGSLYL